MKTDKFLMELHEKILAVLTMNLTSRQIQLLDKLSERFRKITDDLKKKNLTNGNK